MLKRWLLVLVGVVIGFNGITVASEPANVATTYGVVTDGPDLELLLRHQGVMLALIGSLLVVSAFRRELRTAAVVTAGVSLAAFTVLALTTGVNASLRLIAVLDIALLAALAVAAALPDAPRSRSRQRSAGWSSSESR